MFRQSWLLLLAGCPYIFDPPDLSNVDADKPTTDGSDSDTDVDSDTDTDADGDADADAPEVLSFEVSPRMNGIILRFELADDQDNLEGGSIDVSNGTDTWSLPIPGGIGDWNPGGPSEHVLALDKEWMFPGVNEGNPDCDAGIDETWTLTAVDDAGHHSDDASTHLVVPGIGLLGEPDYPYENGGAPPFVFCGEFEGPFQGSRRDDIEAVEFSTPFGGDYFFELEWDKPDTDMDLYIYDLPYFYLLYYPEGYDFSYDFESVTAHLTAGQDWVIRAAYWSSMVNDPPYLARVLVTPE